MSDSKPREMEQQPPSGPLEADLYESYLPSHVGVFPKKQVIPKGAKDSTITSVTVLTLKPDGEFFAEQFAAIAPGTAKGDKEDRRTCLARYQLALFPGAQIIESGGSDASFHIKLTVDTTVSEYQAKDLEDIKKTLLNPLRVMAFCDQINHGIVGSQSARKVGSVNSKTGRIVREIQSGTTTFSLAQLQEMIAAWFKNPEVYLFRRWFGIPDDERTRCPFHDSADKDLAIGTEDSNENGLACFGDQCVQGRDTSRIPMVAKDDSRPSLAKLLLSDERYCARWSRAFKIVADKFTAEQRKEDAKQEALSAGKVSLIIDEDTTTDDILAVVREGFSTLTNLYCDSLGALVTVETNTQTNTLVLQRHNSIEKLIALVERVCDVRIAAKRMLWAGPLPHARAAAVFHRPELRAGLRLLVLVSATPVLDLIGRQIQPPGYDVNTRIFYNGPQIEARLDGLTPRLDEWLSGWTGFCGSPHKSCRTDRDIAHMYAAVFTEVLADSGLFTLHGHVCIQSNQKNAGKDKVATGLGILRERKAPVDLEHHDANRINQAFGNGVHDGCRTFQVTNVECNSDYKNPQVTRWATEEHIRGAKHGGGNWIADPNTTSFVITMNRGTLYYDLADRFYRIDLEIEGDAGSRPFPFDPVEYIKEHRLEIIAEVMGLHLTCLNENHEWRIPEGTDRRFVKWLKVIGTMVDRRGLRGFMQKAEEDGDVNEDREHMTELVRRLHADKKFEWVKAKDLLVLCQSRGSTGLEALTLFPAQIARGARPEAAFGRYVLLRMVGQRFRLPWTDASEGLEVQFVKDADHNTKSGRYHLEQVERPTEISKSIPNMDTTTCAHRAEQVKLTENCGSSGSRNGIAGAAKNVLRQPQMIDSTDITTEYGSSGSNSLESATRMHDLSCNGYTCSEISPPGTAPAAPAAPAKPVKAANNKDSWGGVEL